MGGRYAIWQRIAGLLAALLIAVLPLATAFAGEACADETTASAAAVDTGHSQSLGDTPAPSPCDEGCCSACAQCQCHHVVAHAPPVVMALAGRPSGPERGLRARAQTLTSDPVFGLKRPPRA